MIVTEEIKNVVSKGQLAIRRTGITGEITGAVAIPTFTANLEFPKESGEEQLIGITLTEVGKVEGSVTSTNPALCGGNPTCVNLKVPSKQNLTFTVEAPGHSGEEIKNPVLHLCQTVTPIDLPLSTNLTLLEIVAVGSHFTGTTTIPSITCNGKKAKRLGKEMTETFSGPGSYVINVNPPKA